jgi:hypothetical protein
MLGSERWTGIEEVGRQWTKVLEGKRGLPIPGRLTAPEVFVAAVVIGASGAAKRSVFVPSVIGTQEVVRQSATDSAASAPWCWVSLLLMAVQLV